MVTRVNIVYIMNCFDRDYEIFCGWSCDCPFFLCFSWVFGHKVYLNCRTNVYFLWRCTTINELMINEQVRDREVRVISSDGEQLGIMSSKEAMKLAREAELDLVKIAPNAKPPVCKIIDYGKYRYELARKEKVYNEAVGGDEGFAAGDGYPSCDGEPCLPGQWERLLPIMCSAVPTARASSLWRAMMR